MVYDAPAVGRLPGREPSLSGCPSFLAKGPKPMVNNLQVFLESDPRQWTISTRDTQGRHQIRLRIRLKPELILFWQDRLGSSMFVIFVTEGRPRSKDVPFSL